MIIKSPTATLVILLLVLIGGAITPTSFQAKETKEMAQSEVAIVSAASFNPLNIAPGSMVAAFGQNLATTTAAAADADPVSPGVQLPTILDGVDWLPINIGLPDPSLRGLEISGLKLFAVTATGKLYVRSAM